jgi:dsDNA-specific endonuclease/ATPase MutS2
VDQLLTPEFWKAQIEVATSAPWVVIPLLLIAGIIGWGSKGIVDDRKIKGMMAEINTRERRLQQAHNKQELVTNQVKILRDAVMQEYAKLKKTRKMSLEQQAAELVDVAYNANRVARSSLSTLSVANNELGATLAPTGETDTCAPLFPNITEEFE